MGESLYLSDHQIASSSPLKNVIIRSWWVIVFCTLCSAVYFQAALGRNAIHSELFSRYQEMEKEKLLASRQQDELMLRLQSESDPAWIEMVLMKELGVVPEGWIKVQFKK